MQTTRESRIFVFFFTVIFIVLSSGCTSPVDKVRQGESCVDCDLQNADLSGISLVGVDLSGADLSGANLTDVKIGPGTRFTNANLSNVRVENAKIQGADPSGKEWIFNTTNLTNANLQGAEIAGVDFSGSNLSGANLSSIDASSVDFSFANLAGANFENAQITSDGNFFNADLSGANLSNFDASGAAFMANNFTGTNVENFRFKRLNAPTFPSLEKPDKVYAEIKGALRKIKKTDRAKDMLFDLDLGLTYELSGEADPEDIYGGRRNRGLIAVPHYMEASFYGDLPNKYYEKIDDTFDAEFFFKPDTPSQVLCGMSQEGVLSAFGQHLESEADRKLMLMTLDHLNAGRGGCEKAETNDNQTSDLEDYIYEYYNDLIEISGIKEYKNTTMEPTHIFNRNPTNRLDGPEIALTLTILRDSLPQSQREVEELNTCVNSAYEKFDAGVTSIYDSVARVWIATNMSKFEAMIEKSAEDKKQQVATRQYRSKLSSFATQLYDITDLITGITELQSTMGLEQGAVQIAMTGGDAGEWVENRRKEKETAFKRSMNMCLLSDFRLVRDETKRTDILKKFELASSFKYSDEDLNSLIEQCTSGANIAYLRG